MQVYTKDFEIQCPPQQRSWIKIAQEIGNLTLPGVPIRLILSKIEGNRLTFESSFVDTDREPVWSSLLDINLRQRVSTQPFVAVSIIPTGVAVALITTLQVDDQVRQAYYRGESIPNPWGGAEAIMTHITTNFYPFTAAHAPLLLEWEHTGFGQLVDPRDGAELISSAYVCSPLQGLINSPRPVRNVSVRSSC